MICKPLRKFRGGFYGIRAIFYNPPYSGREPGKLSIEINIRQVSGEENQQAFIFYNLTFPVYFPAGYEFKNGYQAVVLVTATIDEEGKVVDVELDVPLQSAFNKVSIDALKDSQVWLPAVSHNRKIYGSFTQSINFSQSYY